MASTTPLTRPQPVRNRSTSRSRSQPQVSRPTTPLRPPSRTSIRNASTMTPTNSTLASSQQRDQPLLGLEPSFAELSDSMADLEANFLNLQVLNESVSRFNENFAALLYGLNMSAFCVDFPEAPGAESFRRAKEEHARRDVGTEDRSGQGGAASGRAQGMGAQWEESRGYARPSTAADVDATFMTTDTSFVENPPASVRPPRYTNPMAGAAPSSRVPSSGAAGRGRGRGGSTASTRGRGSVTRGGARGGVTRGSTTDRGRIRI